MTSLINNREEAVDDDIIASERAPLLPHASVHHHQQEGCNERTRGSTPPPSSGPPGGGGGTGSSEQRRRLRVLSPSLLPDSRKGQGAKNKNVEQRHGEEQNAKRRLPLRERIFTPKFILVLWIIMNFLTYYDRGAIAATLTEVRADPVIDGGEGVINDAKGGAIVSSFMVGFFLTCPLFAALGGIFSAKQIITTGLLVWAAACISTSVAQNYWMILISRCFVGVGEAGYAGYTVTIIDNIAPRTRRTMWIGLYYSMIPVGTAVGMGLGGVIGRIGQIGSIPGWRVVFATEVIPMIPIIVLNALLPKKYNVVKEGGQADAGTDNAVVGEANEEETPTSTPVPSSLDSDSLAPTSPAFNIAAVRTEEGSGSSPPANAPTSLLDPTASNRSLDSTVSTTATTVSLAIADIVESPTSPALPQGERDAFVPLPQAIKRLARNLNYVLLVFGYAVYTFVLGAVAVWGITMVQQGPLALPTVTASLVMGGIASFTGVTGSIWGGYLVDRLGGSQGWRGLVKCARYNVSIIMIAAPLGGIAITSHNLTLFICAFVVGTFMLFSIIAPINASLLSAVPSELRVYSISFSVFFMHMLGDFPSPMVAGALSDFYSDGCDSLSSTNQTICENLLPDTQVRDCRWMPGHGRENPSCVNIYQMRNAILTLWGTFILVLPAWGIVGIRARRRMLKEEMQKKNKKKKAIDTKKKLRPPTTPIPHRCITPTPGSTTIVILTPPLSDLQLPPQATAPTPTPPDDIEREEQPQ